MAMATEPFGFAEFAESMLGKKLYTKQRELLDACRKGAYVVGRFNNSGGKTKECLVTLVLGALLMWKAKVFSTSGSFRQIKDQLNPALHGFRERFPAWEFLENRINTSDPNCFYHGFSTNDAGRFEGQHGDAKHPLVILADEGKTIRDPVFGAFDRCRPPREHCLIVVVSSAGYAGGEFHALNTSRRDSLTHPPIVQRSSDCPHISPAEIAADEKKWGPDHPLVKSMHYAEFMGFIQGSVVQIQALDDLLADPPAFEPGPRKCFIDFAWSEDAIGDETVIAMRNGNDITIAAAFKEKGLHNVAARAILTLNDLRSKTGLQPHEVEGDADGRGAEIIKAMRGLGWAIGSAHNGGPPRFNDNYANLATEMWVEGSNDIIHRKWRLPIDPDLYAQMINRKIVPSNRGVMCIESKLAMKDPNREGGSVPSSPDRADAVFGAMAPLLVTSPKRVMGFDPEPPMNKSLTGWKRDDMWGGERDENRLPGTYAG